MISVCCCTFLSGNLFTIFLTLHTNPSLINKKMRAWWLWIDKSIGAKISYKLIIDNNGKIICRSDIRLVIKPGSANLQVDSIKPLPNDALMDTEMDTILDKFMSLADFKTPVSQPNKKWLVNSIRISTKSKIWQEYIDLLTGIIFYHVKLALS